jgi:hypothetical protein
MSDELSPEANAFARGPQAVATRLARWQAWRGGGVFISPSIVVPFGPFWGPSWGAYPAYPPVAAPPPVVAQPSRLNPTTGTIAMPRKLTTRMSHSAPEAGER